MREEEGSTAIIEVAPKLVEVFAKPLGEYRYRVAYGGRGGAKSFTFALMSLVFGVQKKIAVMCVRQFFTSIAESFHLELQAAINTFPWLQSFYKVHKSHITGVNGTVFNFGSLEINLNSVKGKTQYDVWIVEEAEDVCEEAWRVFPQSVRKPGSEIWVIYNPTKKDSPTDLRFRQKPPGRSIIIPIQYYDNPYFPAVLDEERRRDKEILNIETYEWIWLGKYLVQSEAQVFFGKYKVKEFTPMHTWEGPYQGLDFGFSQDPTAAVRFWRFESCLYFEYECSSLKLELDDTAYFITEAIPDFEYYETIADSARPEAISHLKSKGLPNLSAAKKGPNSVKEGLSKLLSHKYIYIHPRCKKILYEFENYKYKIDKKTSAILSEVPKGNDHFIDAARYAGEDMQSLINYASIL